MEMTFVRANIFWLIDVIKKIPEISLQILLDFNAASRVTKGVHANLAKLRYYQDQRFSRG
jgi:hypothetical protein